MTKKEMAAKVAALEAQVQMLAAQVAQQGVRRDTMPLTPGMPPSGPIAPYRVTSGATSIQDGAAIHRSLLTFNKKRGVA